MHYKTLVNQTWENDQKTNFAPIFFFFVGLVEILQPSAKNIGNLLVLTENLDLK